jgi:hypothetical protein
VILIWLGSQYGSFEKNHLTRRSGWVFTGISPSDPTLPQSSPNQPSGNEDLHSIEESLPSIFKSNSLWSKFKEEMRVYHRWLGIVFYNSPEFPRSMRLLSLRSTLNSKEARCYWVTATAAATTSASASASLPGSCYFRDIGAGYDSHVHRGDDLNYRERSLRSDAPISDRKCSVKANPRRGRGRETEEKERIKLGADRTAHGSKYDRGGGRL